MGNCLFGGMGDAPPGTLIKVTTSNGGVMEFNPPVTAGSISGEFPNHAIFRARDLFWKPLSDEDDLVPGDSYHLLPILEPRGGGHVRSASAAPALELAHFSAATAEQSEQHSSSSSSSYRMSFDCRRHHRHRGDMFLGARKCRRSSAAKGFWKVRLVIAPEELMEILSQEKRTQELIDSVRTVAKCGGDGGGGGGGGFLGFGGFSDEWSLSASSSRNASSNLGDGF